MRIINKFVSLIRKIIAVALIAFGVLFFIAGMTQPKDGAMIATIIITGVLPIVLGIFVWPKGEKSEKAPEPVTRSEPEPVPVPEPEVKEAAPPFPDQLITHVHPEAPEPAEEPAKPEEPEYKTYAFKLAGISYREKEIMNNILEENVEYTMSKRELLDYGYGDGDTIYKYLEMTYPAELVPEPDNEYDPEAVKVMVDGILVGYVPKGKTKRVKKLLEKDDLDIICGFNAGPFKEIEVDYDDYTGKEKYTIRKRDYSISGTVLIKYQ